MPPAQANRAEDAILTALSGGPRSAAALARSTGMSFAGVLIELEALETAGVVARTARGAVQLTARRDSLVLPGLPTLVCNNINYTPEEGAR
jgi:predicted ArsR family transcriptional regulator